jgi:hypothetical protein
MDTHSCGEIGVCRFGVLFVCLLGYVIRVHGDSIKGAP